MKISDLKQLIKEVIEEGMNSVNLPSFKQYEPKKQSSGNTYSIPGEKPKDGEPMIHVGETATSIGSITKKIIKAIKNSGYSTFKLKFINPNIPGDSHAGYSNNVFEIKLDYNKGILSLSENMSGEYANRMDLFRGEELDVEKLKKAILLELKYWTTEDNHWSTPKALKLKKGDPMIFFRLQGDGYTNIPIK